MGYRQCLPLSVVQMKGKHCRKPHCRNGVVDMLGHYTSIGILIVPIKEEQNGGTVDWLFMLCNVM